MPERWKAVHFVGVGGSGMSPLAEILLRHGTQVSGSDVKASSVTAYLESLGLEFHEGHAAGPRRRRGCRGALVGGAAVEPGDPGSRAPRHPGDPARRAPRRADGGTAGRRRCRRARQDDDHRDARSGARPRRTRSDGRHRWPFRGVRQSCARRPKRAPRRRGGRKRSLVPLVAAARRDRDEHRSRAPRELRHLRRAHASLRAICRVGAERRRGDSLRRRPAP